MFRDGVSEGQFQEVQEIPFFSHQRKVRVSNRKNEANMINIQNGKSQLTAFRLIFLMSIKLKQLKYFNGLYYSKLQSQFCIY